MLKSSLYNNEKINIPLALRLGIMKTKEIARRGGGILKLALRLGIMKTPEEVAKMGIVALFKNCAESIPGLLNKLTMLFVPLIPSVLIGFIYRKTNR